MITELVAHGAVLLVTVVAGQSNHDKVSGMMWVRGDRQGDRKTDRCKLTICRDELAAQRQQQPPDDPASHVGAGVAALSGAVSG